MFHWCRGAMITFYLTLKIAISPQFVAKLQIFFEGELLFGYFLFYKWSCWTLKVHLLDPLPTKREFRSYYRY